MKKFMFPAGLGIILLVTGMLFPVAGGAVLPDANAVHDCASDELHLSGRCPHSVWKHHAGDLGLWVGFAILAFGLSSGWYWFHLKRLKRLEVIVRAMPACAAVVDGGGKIRFLHGESGDIKPPPQRFDDLPEEIRDAFREPVRQVMETGEACRVEYCVQGRRRRAELVRLGREIFGTATVMWTSTDVDDLYCLSERFRRTLKSISDGVIAVDADENITLVNRTAARLFGRSREEMIGRKVWDFAGLIDKSRKDERFTLIRRAMESGITVELSENTELEVFQGGRYHISCAASPIRDEAGHVSGVVLVFRDVTAEVGRAEELREANQLLQAIQDNLPCAFFVKDADDDFRYLMGNRNYADFLSTTCEEIRGKTDSELFPTRENADACRNSDLAAMEQGSCDVNEQVRIGGKSYTFRCIKNRLDRKDGRRLLLGICVDITEEKRLQQELRDALDELKVYVEQEHLLNRCLESVLLNEDEDTAIRFVLKMIGERLKADHAYCFRYDYEQSLILPCQEWKRSGQAERIEIMPHFPVDPEEGWFKLFQERRMLNLPDVSTPEARAVHGRWADFMPEIGVRSLYAIGVWRGQKLWGHIGLSYSGRKNELTEPERDLLQSCAHIVEVILERRLNREELKRSEYEKLLLMDSIRIPIMLFNADLQLIRCNNAALEIAGIPEAEIYLQPCNRSFCGCTERHPECPVVLAGRDLREHRRELQVKGRDYQLRAYPILIDGKLVYVMKTMVDVTELNRALQAARDASRAKSYFLATMSHELRTPLNAVIGFSELLRNGATSPAEREDYLKNISYSGNALLQLVNDVLDLSKLEADQMEFTAGPVDFSELGREVMKVFSFRAIEDELTLQVETASLPELEIDRQRVRQILFNLIGNAVKFTPKHGTITLRAEFRPDNDESGTLRFSVTDTGVGIAPEDQKRLMEPFVQLHNIRGANANNLGTGLGLAISKRMVERMDGQLWLESEPGKGSTFGVALRNVRFHRKADLPAETGTAEAAPADTEDAAVKTVSVLVVDDVDLNLKVLRAMCVKLGVTDIFAVSSAGKALEELEKRPFDLMLTDLWMPGMDGNALREKIRAERRWAAMTVVAVTADSEARENMSFDAVLLKPVTLEKVRQILALTENRGGTGK